MQGARELQELRESRGEQEEQEEQGVITKATAEGVGCCLGRTRYSGPCTGAHRQWCSCWTQHWRRFPSSPCHFCGSAQQYLGICLLTCSSIAWYHRLGMWYPCRCNQAPSTWGRTMRWLRRLRRERGRRAQVSRSAAELVVLMVLVLVLVLVLLVLLLVLVVLLLVVLLLVILLLVVMVVAVVVLLLTSTRHKGRMCWDTRGQWAQWGREGPLRRRVGVVTRGDGRSLVRMRL